MFSPSGKSRKKLILADLLPQLAHFGNLSLLNCKLSELRCELSKNYLPQVFQQFNSSFDFLRTTLIPNPTFVGISAPDHSFYFVVVLWCHGPFPSIRLAVTCSLSVRDILNLQTICCTIFFFFSRLLLMVHLQSFAKHVNRVTYGYAFFKIFCPPSHSRICVTLYLSCLPTN